MIFRCDNKYYTVSYSEGATEQQYEEPFEYSDDLIECQEVVEREVTIKKWVLKDND